MRAHRRLEDYYAYGDDIPAAKQHPWYSNGMLVMLVVLIVVVIVYGVSRMIHSVQHGCDPEEEASQELVKPSKQSETRQPAGNGYVTMGEAV